MTSNISQSYPYSSESDEERAAALAAVYAARQGLEEQVTAETSPLGDVRPGENGAPIKWWTWVCPRCIEGRLHVAGYSRDRHGLYTVCDRCGSTFAR